MTSALLIQRAGSATTVLAGPGPVGDIILQWKAAVQADCGRPQVSIGGVVPILEVVELKPVRSHKLRSGALVPVAAEPAGDPPAGDPPAGDPPAGDPPAGDPPAGDPPAGDPPAGDTEAAPTGRRRK